MSSVDSLDWISPGWRVALTFVLEDVQQHPQPDPGDARCDSGKHLQAASNVHCGEKTPKERTSGGHKE